MKLSEHDVKMLKKLVYDWNELNDEMDEFQYMEPAKPDLLKFVEEFSERLENEK